MYASFQRKKLRTLFKPHSKSLHNQQLLEMLSQPSHLLHKTSVLSYRKDIPFKRSFRF